MSEADFSQNYVTRTGFGPDLTRLFEYKNVTPIEIAERMNIHNSTIYYWMHGRSLPNLKGLFKLAKALDVTPEFLLGLVQESDWNK